MLLMIILLSFFSLLILLLFFFYLSFLIGYFVSGVPFVPTKKEDIPKLLEIMNLKEGEVLVDLGCGNARLLIEAEKRYKVKTIGYEISLFAFIISKINIFLKKSKTKVYLKNFFKVNFLNLKADVIFCYLLPNVMKRLSKKFKKELRPGTRILSLAFPLPHWSNEKIKYLKEHNRRGRVYLYYK